MRTGSLVLILLWKNERDVKAVVVAGRQIERNALRVVAMVGLGIGRLGKYEILYNTVVGRSLLVMANLSKQISGDGR